MLDILEVEDVQLGEFVISMQLRNRLTNFRWVQATVSGPADHSDSGEFLNELNQFCSHIVLPLVIGGDFNLIRSDKDKNNDNINKGLMDAFNSFIG